MQYSKMNPSAYGNILHKGQTLSSLCNQAQSPGGGPSKGNTAIIHVSEKCEWSSGNQSALRDKDD